MVGYLAIVLDRFLGWVIYYLGRHLGRRGFCPYCNSSPPLQTCTICEGSYDYGPGMRPSRKIEWLRRWDEHCGRGTVAR